MLKIVILFTLFLHLIWAIWRQVMNQKTLSWPSVQGEIISAVVDNTDDGDYDSETGFLEELFFWISLVIGFLFYSKPVNIHYRYSIAGVTYKSSLFSYGQRRFYFSSDHNRITSLYPIGRQLPVYYNPDDVSKAVINRDSVNFIRLFLTSNWVFNTVGVILLYGLFRLWY
jgi:hypothetical protein